MGLVAVGLWVAAVWGLCGKAKSCERGVTGDGFSWDRRIARKLAVPCTAHGVGSVGWGGKRLCTAF